jgi:hypothetical protein
MVGAAFCRLSRKDFMSLLEQNKLIVQRYRLSGQPWPATSVDIARWAIHQGLWEIHQSRVVRQCADQIAEAMRQEYITDPQGRRVRAKHVAPYPEDGRLPLKWDDMRTASRNHMEMSFAYKRQLIVGDCRQLKNDIDSYNQNYNNGSHIQSIFDFTYDLEELELGNMPAA